MKKRTLSVAAFSATTLLLALVVGCPNPMGPVQEGSRGGSLTVSIKNAVNAKTLVPPISMDAKGYTITGAGPNGATFSKSSSGEPVTADELASGTWTVTVKALNADDTVIGQGLGTAEVRIGETVSLAITVTPLGGTGSLSLSVSWTAPLQNPSIQASLQAPKPPPDGSVPSLDFAISGSHATCTSSMIPSGYYTLSLQLLEKGTAVTGAVEAVRIVAGQTTSGVYTFTVSLGMLEVNIVPALANPIPVSISGVPSTVEEGTSVTATAMLSDGTANATYAWYLNGVSVGTGPTCSLGSDLALGHYRLDVMVFTPDGTRAGSATAIFQVGSAGPNITIAQATRAAQTVAGTVSLVDGWDELWIVTGSSYPYTVSFSTPGLSMTGTKIQGQYGDDIYTLTLTLSNYSDSATGYTANGVVNITDTGVKRITANVTLSGGPVTTMTWDVSLDKYSGFGTVTGTIMCNGISFDADTLSAASTYRAVRAWQAMFDGVITVMANPGAWTVNGSEISYSTAGLEMTGTRTVTENIETTDVTITYSSYASNHIYTLTGMVHLSSTSNTSSNAVSLTSTMDLTLSGGPITTLTCSNVTASGSPRGQRVYLTIVTGTVVCNGTAFDAKVMSWND